MRLLWSPSSRHEGLQHPQVRRTFRIDRIGHLDPELLQDYQRNSFGVGAPTSVVEDIAGTALEDFGAIASRYVKGSPLVKRGPVGLMREASAIVGVLLARAPNLKRIEQQFGMPPTANFVLASDSPFWKLTHA